MALDARKESFFLVDTDGYICLFTNMRLDRDTIPAGLYCYDVRDADCDGTFAEIQPFVLVNHWGTIISKEPIPLNEYGCYWPEQEEFYLPPSVTLDAFVNTSIAKLTEPYLSEDEKHQLGKSIDAIPDDLFRIRHKPFMSRSGEDQERLQDFWCIHAADINVPASEFLGMTRDEYQTWVDGLLALDDGSYHEMGKSHFQLSPVAFKVGQQLLHQGGIDQTISSAAFRSARVSASHNTSPLLSQFFKQIPSDRDCMLSSFFDATTPNMVLYDPGDEIIAIMTDKDVLHKEDFAQMMKDAGMKASEALWSKVWTQFSADFPAAAADVPLKVQAQTAIEKVYSSLTRDFAVNHAQPKPSLEDAIQSAGARTTENDQSAPAPGDRAEKTPPPERQ